MPNENLEEIKEFWEKSSSVEVDERNLRPVAPDEQIQNFLEKNIIKYLQQDWKCLEIGCGDGFSTVKFAPSVKKILAVDYVEKLIERAGKKALAENIKNIEFVHGNALELQEITKEKFDALISIRCLINLASWENQAKVLENIANLIKPGGYVFIAEGWEEGLLGMQELWRKHNLGEFKKAPFNQFIEKKNFLKAIENNFEVINYHGLGYYLFMSRVLQPAYLFPEKPDHNHKINKVAARMLMENHNLESAFPECDYAGLYVLKRKS
ncbi:hypothetical protein BROC_02280 [Candidatus Brocadiaceae bacterium]|nr:hypothetical protein BROC_02280 [Candidatus Brocadiaceae bacterium]